MGNDQGKESLPGGSSPGEVPTPGPDLPPGAPTPHPLIYQSQGFRRVVDLADKIAQTDCSVLLLGETGTGKGALARHMHEASPRRGGPFVVCSAGEIQKGLEQNELYGHASEAYSGAETNKVGLFQAARRGTLFLDDADKFKPGARLLLLRFLDDHMIRPVGSSRFVPSEARLIIAASQDLDSLARKGSYLVDLVYRLGELAIRIPPLRERREDILPLAVHFATAAALKFGQHTPLFDREAARILETQEWKWNVRQLARVVSDAILRSPGPIITGDLIAEILCLTTSIASVQEELRRLAVLPLEERRSAAVIRSALELTRGNGALAAKALGIPLRTFRRDTERYGIRWQPR